MLAAIKPLPTPFRSRPIDPSLVVSNAVTLTQGTVASGGSRYEANLIAKYMFETGHGSIAYDTSGVAPEAGSDTLRQRHLGRRLGYRRSAPGGKAQASTSASQKLAQHDHKAPASSPSRLGSPRRT